MPSTTIAVGTLARQPRLAYDHQKVAVLVLIVDVPADPERATDEPVRHQVKATGPLAQYAAEQLDQDDEVVVVGTVRRERFRPDEGRATDTVDWLVATVIAKSVGVPRTPTTPAPRPLTLVRPAPAADQPRRSAPVRVLAPAA